MAAFNTAAGQQLPDGHRTAERRSLAMHRAIAEQLDAAGVARARTRVAKWTSDGGPVAPHWATQWAALLSGSPAAVAEAISRDDPQMTQLRQTTPFAGMLAPAERWQILRDVH